MNLFSSAIKTQVEANMAYNDSQSNARNISQLEHRIEALEAHLRLEWSESNDKYYIVTPPNDSLRKDL